jgi:hypothetical protein
MALGGDIWQMKAQSCAVFLQIKLDRTLKLRYTYQYIQIIQKNLNNLDSGGDDNGERG